MNTHPQHGEAATGLLSAVVLVVVIGALAQLLGFDSIGLLGDAINWTADHVLVPIVNGIGDLFEKLIKTAQGRN